MRDKITILVKRAATYINDDGTLIEGIGDLILEYGEMLYLEDLNCLVIGDGKLYSTEEDAQDHTTSTYWSSIRYLEDKYAWVGGSVVKELVVDHDVFAKPVNIKLYGQSTFEKEISSTDTSTLIANTQFVQNLTDSKIKTAITALKGTIDSSGSAPSKTNTITAFSEVDGKVTVKFEPISITYDQISDGTETALPLPATEKPLSANLTAAVGQSTKYAKEDHVHPMTDGGSVRLPAYVANGNAYPVGDEIDVDITGNAATADALNSNAGSKTKPIYFNEGTPAQCSDTLDVNITGNAATATKVGSATVGESGKPIYLDSGTAKQCSNTLSVSISGSSASCTGNSATATKLNTNAGTSDKPVYFSGGIPVQCNGTLAVNITGNAATASKVGSTTAGSSTRPIYLNGGVATQCGTSLAVSVTGSSATVNSVSGNSFYISGVKAASGQLYYNTTVSVNSNNVLLGAAWNDIAEFREGIGGNGQCVCEDGNGKLIQSSKHLQKCPYVVSDTYGFAIGETEKCKLPVAISGRVLVNTKQTLKVGDVVCAGKDGCVDKMSRLEIILFPDRILGTVSEVPTYDVWNDKIKVHNRVWITIK